jgi:small-conductance mechanosensitive channel/CRP-like cAMP-binding protein
MKDMVETLRARVEQIAPSWAGYSTILLALVVVIGLRRLLPIESRSRTRTPMGFLVIALGLRLAAPAALWAGYWQAWGLLNFLSLLCLVVGLTGIAGVLVFDLALRRRPTPAVLRDMIQILLVGTIFIAILTEHGFDPVSLAATGGVLTAVIGFALQSTIANLFAGVALPLERQLAIGDWIQIVGHIGRIREIKWRSTTIVTKDGDHVIVPNNQLLTTDVLNFSRPTEVHRMWQRVSIHYRHPPNEVKAALLGALRGAPGVLDQPAPDCFPVEFAESAVVYALRFWIADFASSEPIEGEVRTRVWYAARRAGLEMPFPIRTIVQHAPSVEDTTSPRLAALDRVDLFAPIDGECRTQLAETMREQHFGAGEDIIRQDAPGNSLFIISRGDVEVRVGVDGASRGIARLGPGQFFGEMSLMTGEARNATCTAITDTVCYVIDQAAFRCVLDTRPAVAEDISSILARRQTELEASRDGLSAEAAERRARDTRSNLLRAIRDVFGV